MSDTTPTLPVPSKEQLLEALLYTRGGEVSFKQVAKSIGCPVEQVQNIAESLGEQLSGRGVALSIGESGVALVTAPEVSDYVVSWQQLELQGNLSQSALDVLTIVLYQGPVTKAEIDLIRGVNSATMVRTLLVRGLVQRDKKDGAILYSATIDLLGFLGITNVKELPQYATIRGEMNDRRKALIEVAQKSDSDDNKKEYEND